MENKSQVNSDRFMEDAEIVQLYFDKSENAIRETSKKYGNYCYKIAYNILFCREDSEECVNDTYMRAWDAIPPFRPSRLSTYLGKITRNLALNVYEKSHRQKRGGGQVEAAFDELDELLAGKGNPEETLELEHLTQCINAYLRTLSKLNRMVFVGRYWHLDSIDAIAEHLGIGQSRTKTILFRTRKGLREYLEKEGILV